MRRVFLTFLLLVMALSIKAVTGTVYVKAEEAPYLYSWCSYDGKTVELLGSWPGTLMTEMEEVKGEIFWKMTITTPEGVSSFNIIFNNAQNNWQTADIIGLSSDRYFLYDGNSAYEDITEEYEKVPNAEISQVEIEGYFGGIMQNSGVHVYTLEVDLSYYEYDYQFRLLINGSIYGDVVSNLTIDSPEGWVIKEGNYLRLCHSITDYKFYRFTAIWDANPDPLEGWTLKVEGKNYKYELINEEEWQILAAFYQSANQSDGWVQKWDFTPSIHSVKTLPGVTASNGHVIGVNLSNNGLTGTFPLALLALPQLESLNLSGNQLTGDLGMTLAAYAKANPTMPITLKTVNISDNQFTGNIGLFAACCPSLQSLDASSNCLEDVYPLISTNVTSLNLGQQTIGRIVDLHLAHLTVDDIATKVPSILLYDHANQTFTPNINLLCTTQDNSWGMIMSYQNGKLTVPYVSEQNTYYGENGETLNVAVVNNNGTREGSTFRITFSFDEGDGNFDGKVNVLDLQTDILYIMENYLSRPFNFTAANLWKDETINVQDIISLVNLLMDMETGEETASARRSGSENNDAGDAVVYMKGGQLMLNTERPVAAFDIVVAGTSETQLSNLCSQLKRTGMTVSTKATPKGVRIIGYSLSGSCIPAGTTAIGMLGENASVSSAMLSDSDANAINVRIGGEATGVNDVQCSTLNVQRYDLQGRKLSTPKKGLYISNGHKIIK